MSVKHALLFGSIFLSCLHASCSEGREGPADTAAQEDVPDRPDVSTDPLDVRETREEPVQEAGDPDADAPADPWGEKKLLFGIAGHWWWLVDEAMRGRFIDEYRLLGATCIRLGLDWIQIEPDEGTRDYSTFDAILADFHDAGIEIVGLFYTAPSWAAADGEWNPGDALRHDKIEAMAATAGDMAAHFSEISLWEFWNEPWGAMGDGAEFALWFAAFRDSVKTARPDALVGAGSTFSEDDSTLAFVSSFYGALGVNRPDAIVIHPYRKETHPPEVNISQIEAVHALDPSVEVWITEYGWDTRAGFSWEEQSTGFLSAIEWMSCQDYIRLANFHMLHDWGEDHEPHEGYGLVTREFIALDPFQRKDAWESFRAMRAGEIAGGCRP